LDAGADIKTVAEMMNHSDPAMILRNYQHTSASARQNVVASLSGFACLDMSVSKREGADKLSDPL
jgi:hypothetical protein